MTARIPPLSSPDIHANEQLLSEQLSKILRKPPKCRKHTLTHGEKLRADTPQNEIGFIEAHPETEIEYGDPSSSSVSTLNADANANLECVLPADREKPDSASMLRNATVIKTTRRARFRHGARQISSWLITIGVTAFITACTTVILLGIPQSLELVSWQTTEASTPLDGPTPKTVKVNTVRVKIAPPSP